MLVLYVVGMVYFGVAAIGGSGWSVVLACGCAYFAGQLKREGRGEVS